MTRNTTRALCVAALAFLALPYAAGAQPLQEWVAFDRPGTSYCYTQTGYDMVVVDPNNGNTYMTGYCYNVVSSSSPYSRYDLIVIGYNPTGGFLWADVYNGTYSSGSSYEYATAIDVDPSGNVYVGAYGDAPSSTYDDGFVRSYTSGGTLRWHTQLGGTGSTYEYVRGLKHDGGSRVYVQAQTNYNHSLYILNDATGGVICQGEYDPSSNIYMYKDAIHVDGAGNGYVAGHGYDGGGSGYNHIVTKFDSSCNRQWTVTRDYGSSDYLYGGLTGDAAGNVVATGYCYNAVASNSRYDACSARWDTNGNFVGSDVYHSPVYTYSYDYARGVVMGSTGASYVVGYGYNDTGAGLEYDQFMIMYDAAMNRQSVTYHDGQPGYYSDYAYAIDADNDYVYTAGFDYYHFNYYGSRTDAVVVGYNPSSGVEDFADWYDHGLYRYPYDYLYHIDADQAGCFAAMGRASDTNGYYGFLTMKYCGDTGCPTLEAKASGPYVWECNAPYNSSGMVSGSRSCSPTGEVPQAQWSSNCGSFDNSTNLDTTFTTQSPPPCPWDCDITLTVSDSTGASDSDTTSVTVEDTTDPVMTPKPGNTTWECDSIQPPPTVTCTDICDPDVPVDYTETPQNCGGCDAEYELDRTWFCDDDCLNSDGHTQIITVQDTTPPTMLTVEGWTYCFAPPVNHVYYCMDKGGFPTTIRDNCETNYTNLCETGEPDTGWYISDCTSSQPDNGNGDGNTIDDCIFTEDWVCFRLERQGEVYSGREYYLWGTAYDDCGNETGDIKVGTIYIAHDSDEHLDQNCDQIK